MTSTSQGKPQPAPFGPINPSLPPPPPSSNAQPSNPANAQAGDESAGSGVQVGRGEWKLKDIGLWPDERVGGMFRRQVKVLLQVRKHIQLLHVSSIDKLCGTWRLRTNCRIRMLISSHFWCHAYRHHIASMRSSTTSSHSTPYLDYTSCLRTPTAPAVSSP